MMDRVIGFAAYFLGLVALVVSLCEGWLECVFITACYLGAFTYLGRKDADKVDCNEHRRW